MRELTPALGQTAEHHRDVPAALPDPGTLERVDGERWRVPRAAAPSRRGRFRQRWHWRVLAGAARSTRSGRPTLDVQILQTATSLELLAVAAYQAALGLLFIADGNAVVRHFAETTMSQHNGHADAFAAQTKSLGGKEQARPNPEYVAVVEETKPKPTGPAEVVNLASTLKTVATETDLANLALLEDSDSKGLFASVMGVECQHLATLRAVGALLAAGDAGTALIAIPTNVAKLPKAAGSVAFPAPFESTTMASPPEEGAVK